ncbi:MAG: alanine--tRNA ligase, partial [Pseudomonadota bacterium]|nr:alanine--tRNA ligase [Pseudomonadota bacterium]
RFDFAHSQAMTDEEIHEVEKLVNAEIRSNHAVDTRLMKYDEAVRCGAMALFGEKYGDEVRVISMGEFSTELCGGTHVGRTGDIGIFKIVGELAVASGIRRIEAVTAGAAVIYMQHQEDILHEVARNLKVQPQDVTARLSQILENVRQMEKDLGRLKARVATSSLDGLVKKALTFKGVKVLSEKIDGADAKILREVMDAVKQRLGSCVVVLASTDVDKVTLIAGVSSDMTERIKAGELVSFAASGVGGKGGGRADMAQAGGNQPDKLPAVLSSVPDWVRNKMA